MAADNPAVRLTRRSEVTRPEMLGDCRNKVKAQLARQKDSGHRSVRGRSESAGGSGHGRRCVPHRLCRNQLHGSSPGAKVGRGIRRLSWIAAPVIRGRRL